MVRIGTSTGWSNEIRVVDQKQRSHLPQLFSSSTQPETTTKRKTDVHVNQSIDAEPAKSERHHDQSPIGHAYVRADGVDQLWSEEIAVV